MTSGDERLPLAAAERPTLALARPRWRRGGFASPVWRQFRRSRTALLGLAIIAVFLLVALLAPVIAHPSPIGFSLGDQLLPPSAAHLLGTDELGRDILSRLIWGGRITLLITTGAVVKAAESVTGSLQ